MSPRPIVMMCATLVAAAPLLAQNPPAPQQRTLVIPHVLELAGALSAELDRLDHAHQAYVAATGRLLQLHAAVRDRAARTVTALKAQPAGRSAELQRLEQQLSAQNQQTMADLQRAMLQAQQEYDAASNALKAKHEAMMNAIRNIR